MKPSDELPETFGLHHSRRPADELKEKMAEFKESVMGQRCAAPDCYRLFGVRAHHVIYKQHLKVEDEWRRENALPLCDEHHEKHHNRSKVLSLDALSEENLAFGNEVLGEAAEYYWQRYYAPSVETNT